jgi:DNA-binding NtrC family response regulator
MTASPPIVLVVDDERAIREELAFALGYHGFQAREAKDGEAGLQAALDPAVAAVLLDIKMPRMDGLEVLQKLREARPELPVIVISGHGDIDTAVLAVKKGAYDFLQKPFGSDRVLVSVKNALAAAKLAEQNDELARALERDTQLLGRSEAMQQVRARVDKVAVSDAAVLITGENGTGKEMVARRLHHQSRRARGPFVAINCAAIPEDLVESELFGHEKGAFTGADRARLGLFRQAEGGTLFLDEVSEADPEAQARLLRALEERQVRPVGSDRSEKFDVRIVAATNRDPRAAVQEGRLREDLYYRLAVVSVRLPPLRERSGDVARLAAAFLSEFAKPGSKAATLPAALLHELQRRAFPGNVRELRNLVQRLVAEAGNGPLAETLPKEAAVLSSSGDAPQSLELAALEQWAIRRALQHAGGNKAEAARLLGIARRTLYTKLAERDPDAPE